MYSMFTVYPYLFACLYFVQRQNVDHSSHGSVIGYTLSLSVFVRSLKRRQTPWLSAEVEPVKTCGVSKFRLGGISGLHIL